MFGLVLIAVGAILVWAVNARPEQVDIVAVGWILMAVGLVMALAELAYWDRIRKWWSADRP